jgi:hypothetical protein
MNSKGDPEFWQLYRRLPVEVRAQAQAAYAMFALNPRHPSLHFKCIDEEEQTYSARVGLKYRVLGTLRGEDISWFWIGSHGDYDKLLS